MSKKAIHTYYNALHKTIQYGRSRNEQTVRQPFISLLNVYAGKNNLMLLTELAFKDKRIIPDGTLKNAMSLDCGYWESKDEKDDLDAAIKAKIQKGYPLVNTLFEDTQTAVLFQNGNKVFVNMFTHKSGIFARTF